MNRPRNADHVARTCERFVYSTVKLTRFCIQLSNMEGKFFEKFMSCAKVMWAFFLDCFSDADWLGEQTPVTWI